MGVRQTGGNRGPLLIQANRGKTARQDALQGPCDGRTIPGYPQKQCPAPLKTTRYQRELPAPTAQGKNKGGSSLLGPVKWLLSRQRSAGSGRADVVGSRTYRSRQKAGMGSVTQSGGEGPEAGRGPGLGGFSWPLGGWGLIREARPVKATPRTREDNSLPILAPGWETRAPTQR